MNYIKQVLDLFSGYKTYIIGTAMILHGGADVVLGLLHGQPLNTVSLSEAGAGLGFITARRAVDR